MTNVIPINSKKEDELEKTIKNYLFVLNHLTDFHICLLQPVEDWGNYYALTYNFKEELSELEFDTRLEFFEEALNAITDIILAEAYFKNRMSNDLQASHTSH